jgi:hypothetical protein
MLPGRLASFGAGTGESKIFKMQGGEELLELSKSHTAGSAPLFRAAFKSR